jgi:hypothetical protein
MMIQYPRTRDRTVSYGHYNLVYYENQGGFSQTYPSSPMSNGYDQKHISDVVTADYARLKASGAIINNPVSYWSSLDDFQGSGHVVGYAIQDGNWHQWTGGLSYYYLGFGGAPLIQSIPLFTDEDYDDVDKLVADTKQKALARMDKTPYTFLEDMGEIGETLRFIKSPLRSLKSLLEKFQKQTLKASRAKSRKRKSRITPKLEKREFAKVAADVWLEYRFAASPLVRSTYEALLALRHENIPMIETRRSTGFQLKQSNETQEYTFDLNANVSVTFQINSARLVRVTSGILYWVDNPIEDFRRTLGVRFKDFPEGIWQLMPLSFMVDRVFDCSSMLRGATNILDPNLTILAGWSMVDRGGTNQTTMSKYADTNMTGISGRGETLVRKRRQFDRVIWEPTISDTLPVPNWSGLVQDISSLADLASIVGGRFQGLKTGKLTQDNMKRLF